MPVSVSTLTRRMLLVEPVRAGGPPGAAPNENGTFTRMLSIFAIFMTLTLCDGFRRAAARHAIGRPAAWRRSAGHRAVPAPEDGWPGERAPPAVRARAQASRLRQARSRCGRRRS